MNKSRLEWKVGLFVFIGLVLLAGAAAPVQQGHHVLPSHL